MGTIRGHCVSLPHSKTTDIWFFSVIFGCQSSPAATASGRVAFPVIPVAPNIATFLIVSDITLNIPDARYSNSLTTNWDPYREYFHLNVHFDICRNAFCGLQEVRADRPLPPQRHLKEPGWSQICVKCREVRIILGVHFTSVYTPIIYNSHLFTRIISAPVFLENVWKCY